VVDPDAFNELYEREWASVFRVALALTNDWDDASDISQETFRRVWERREAIDWNRPARPLLLVTARRLAVDRFRRLARNMRIGTAEHVVGTSTLGSDGHVRWLDLRRTLSGLSRTERAAIVLVGVIGVTYDEAAGTLGLSSGAVRAAVSRGRGKLEAGS
jgi:RNA polymerase sigma-70 factor (ECF subfamily)